MQVFRGIFRERYRIFRKVGIGNFEVQLLILAAIFGGSDNRTAKDEKKYLETLSFLTQKKRAVVQPAFSYILSNTVNVIYTGE